MITKAKLTVASNIKRLASQLRYNSVSLGKATDTSQTTMNRLMSPERSQQDPRLTTIELVASTLDTEVWKLFFEEMPLELFQDKTLSTMIKTLAECSPENRRRIYDQIESIARSDKMEKELKALKGK